MSVKIVHEEIRRFLESPEPEVLCLKGKWGVGKTYAWNHYLREVAMSGKIGLKRYSYVSLFGLKNLEDIKYALFEGTIDVKDLDKGPNPASLNKAFKWVKNNYRKGAAVITRIPILQPYLGGSERSLFFLVRDQIVCIDDLERAGGDLEAKDALGLISDLKEQRKCKVALLLNDEKLSDTDKSDYEQQLEKVVDTRLDFSPTPQEAADIVFPNPEGVQKLLHKNSITLGITNIRVIKKIERIVMRFEEIFGKSNPIMTQTAHTATLLGWSVYQPQEAPPADFLNDFSRIHGLTRDKENTPENERAWQELLRTYDYSSSDEFDLVVLETIKNGYFDAGSLSEAAKKQAEVIKDTQGKMAFEAAWNMYHNSFDDNEVEVMDAMYSSAKCNAKYIEPMNLDSTVSVLKEFGRVDDAKDLIKHYIAARSPEEELFDLGRSVFSRDIKDPDLLAAFKEKRESYQDARDPGEVLAAIATNRGWNPEDLDLVSKLTADDLYALFKNTKGTQLHRMVRSALDFGTIGGVSEEVKEIAKNATIALKRIAKESKLNARRVASQGIKVEDESVAQEDSSVS